MTAVTGGIRKNSAAIWFTAPLRYAVYPSARFIPAKVRAFVEFVAAELRTPQA
jgi:hypothetical protein